MTERRAHQCSLAELLYATNNMAAPSALLLATVHNYFSQFVEMQQEKLNEGQTQRESQLGRNRGRRH